MDFLPPASVFYHADVEPVALILRVATFCVYLGHGVPALVGDQALLRYLETAGFAGPLGERLLPLIGWMDVVVAWVCLLYPTTAVVAWAFTWALGAAVVRLAAGDSLWSFVRQTPNWASPLALLYLQTTRVAGYVPDAPLWLLEVHRRVPWVWPGVATMFTMHLQCCLFVFVVATGVCLFMRFIMGPLILVEVDEGKEAASRRGGGNGATATATNGARRNGRHREAASDSKDGATESKKGR